MLTMEGEKGVNDTSWREMGMGSDSLLKERCLVFVAFLKPLIPDGSTQKIVVRYNRVCRRVGGNGRGGYIHFRGI
jgi:hypothetical protein